ncbi:MAG TPA: hypothetical protein VGK48_24495 [Terriglobia bacterium]|jgi:hypothetical protein
MSLKHTLLISAAFLMAPHAFGASPQGKTATAKSLRCTFKLYTTATWNKAGAAEAAVKPVTLVLLFDSINADEGTAQLKNGTEDSDIIVKQGGGYLNFIQAFRTGPLYTTTVFDKETPDGKLKAVHSRHEYYTTPLAGSTSSPEQYYGECEVTSS